MITVFLFVLSVVSMRIAAWDDNTVRRFPDKFLFGVASSAYQIEGGWNEDGKGENIWDRLVHEHLERIEGNATGDVSADSYHQYERDVEMLRELGVDFYRFSISWARILPTGFSNKINEAGIEYYKNLIDLLLQYNIEPVVTMYHLDLPQTLQDFGGWTNPLIADWFEDYAKVLFDNFGDKVKKWITINQPDSVCIDGYEKGMLAPQLNMGGAAGYICAKNVLIAHARAYRLYENQYKTRFGGTVGISIAINWYEPANRNSTDHVKAAELYREFSIDLYMNPIFSEYGGFPTSIKDIVTKKSEQQGFPRSRIPSLSSEEQRLIKGSADFVAMNHYTTFLVQPAKPGLHVSPSFDDDADVKITQGKIWKKAKSSWLKSYPFGLYKACLYINKKYNYPTVLISENGWSTDVGLRDEDRVSTIREYLDALLFALADGTNAIGYTAWSLMDNFEWTAGYTERFGLYEVDFNSEKKTRKARKSALVYKEIISSRIINKSYEPESLNIKLSNRRLMMKAKTEL